MSELQVVCFDAADTLFTERSSRAEMYAEEFATLGAQVEPARMARWMAAAHDETPARVDGAPRYSPAWFETFIARLLRRAELEADPAELRARLEQRFLDPRSYVVFGDVFPCLDELLERGLRLAVVSNWSAALPELLHGLGLGRWFEVLAVSAIVGHDKPDPRLFGWALERLGVPAAAACHVGDSAAKDVAGARRTGMRAFHLDRSGREPAGEGRLTGLEQLPGRLDG